MLVLQLEYMSKYLLIILSSFALLWWIFNSFFVAVLVWLWCGALAKYLLMPTMFKVVRSRNQHFIKEFLKYDVFICMLAGFPFFFFCVLLVFYSGSSYFLRRLVIILYKKYKRVLKEQKSHNTSQKPNT
jgi:hypothetical protein